MGINHTSPNSEPEGPTNGDDLVNSPASENLLDEGEDTSATFAQNRSPRIYISRELVNQVVRLGVPNEAGPVGRVVGALASQAIALGRGWLPSASDAVAVDLAIEHRLNELCAIHAGIFRTLSELASATEQNTLLNTLKQDHE